MSSKFSTIFGVAVSATLVTFACSPVSAAPITPLPTLPPAVAAAAPITPLPTLPPAVAIG